MAMSNQQAVEFYREETSSMAVNGSRRMAFKVSTSFGAMYTVASYLPGQEVICLQVLNKFFYDHGVSRVQMRIPLIPSAYFICPLGNSLISYD